MLGFSTSIAFPMGKWLVHWGGQNIKFSVVFKSTGGGGIRENGNLYSQSVYDKNDFGF